MEEDPQAQEKRKKETENQEGEEKGKLELVLGAQLPHHQGNGGGTAENIQKIQVNSTAPIILRAAAQSDPKLTQHHQNYKQYHR